MIVLLLMSQQQKSHPHRVSDFESIDTQPEKKLWKEITRKKNPSNYNEE